MRGGLRIDDMKTVQVSKAIIKRGETYLLVKRSPEASRFSETWDFTGGRIDPGETKEEALVREVLEETGLTVSTHAFVGAFPYEHTRDDELIMLNLFAVTVKQRVISLSHEHTEYAWFKVKEIQKLDLHPSVKIFLKQR